MTKLLIVLLTSVLMGSTNNVKESSPRAEKNSVKSLYKPKKPSSVRAKKLYPLYKNVKYVAGSNVFGMLAMLGKSSKVVVIVRLKSNGKLYVVTVVIYSGKRVVAIRDLVVNGKFDGVDLVFVEPNTTPVCTKTTCTSKQMAAANKLFMFGLITTKFREHLWYYLKYSQGGKKTNHLGYY